MPATWWLLAPTRDRGRPVSALVTNLATVYVDLLRPWSNEQLDLFYSHALRRGARELLEHDPGTRPIGLLATAIPGLKRLIVVTYAIHVAAYESARAANASHEHMLDVIERGSAGALLRCHLALDADLAAGDARSHPDAGHVWRAVVYDATGVAIADLDRNSDPLPAHGLAQQAMDWVAEAIDLVDRGDDARREAMAEALARLLALRAFTHLARRAV